MEHPQIKKENVMTITTNDLMDSKLGPTDLGEKFFNALWWFENPFCDEAVKEVSIKTEIPEQGIREYIDSDEGKAQVLEERQSSIDHVADNLFGIHLKKPYVRLGDIPTKWQVNAAYDHAIKFLDEREKQRQNELTKQDLEKIKSAGKLMQKPTDKMETIRQLESLLKELKPEPV